MHPLAEFIYNDAKDRLSGVDLRELHRKTVLITGATGLVGTYFLASLKVAETKGVKPRVIAAAHRKPDEYLADLLPKNSKVMSGDLTEQKFLDKLPKADYIVHASGYGQPGKFLADQVKTLKLNTTATFSLLEKLEKAGKFLFVSTSEVYSGCPHVPYKETDIGRTNTDHKRACYIEGKRCGEAIAYSHRSNGVHAKAARLSLAYGPGTKKGDERVLNSFIAKGLSGDISMMDSGQAKRTYCYITDAVEMMWDILLRGEDFIYNVGGESKTTIADLGKKIGKYLKVPVTVPRAAEGLGGAPEDVWLDLSKVKNEFGKKDFVPLEDGLAKTIEWQKILYRNK